MKPLETYRGVVYPWELDHVGHLNVQHYVRRFDEATWNLLASFGMTPIYQRESRCSAVALEQHVKYFREVLSGSRLFIRSRILEFGNKTIRFDHELVDADGEEVVAHMELVGAHLDLDVRKSRPWPDALRARAQELLAT